MKYFSLSHQRERPQPDCWWRASGSQGWIPALRSCCFVVIAFGLSGDGQTTRFVIRFPDAYEAKPFVVASSNLPIGMGVTETTPTGCTVTFASPPTAGTDNIEITWMVQE